MSFSAVIVAAGAGLRAGPGLPKTWRTLGGRPVLRWSVEAFVAAGASEIVLVVAPDRQAAATAALVGLPRWRAIAGGETRAESVLLGLRELGSAANGHVLIHDAARPFVASTHIQRLLAALSEADGAVPVLPVSDTLKRRAGGTATTESREGLYRAQTPQAFRHDALLAAYRSWPADRTPTDDASVMEAAGGTVALVPGDPILMKLTYTEDFAMAEALAAPRRVVRTGFGIDAHRFGPGQAVWLCGVELPHSHGLEGHSDADCALHALTDALLGAAAEGDIGQHFPPGDARWKGAASHHFLLHAAGLIASRGGRILNVDVTVICEQPKVGPHRQAMRARLAALLGLPLAAVSVKATTTEGMGFTGRGEGILAQAVAAVEFPADDGGNAPE